MPRPHSDYTFRPEPAAFRPEMITFRLKPAAFHPGLAAFRPEVTTFRLKSARFRLKTIKIRGENGHLESGGNAEGKRMAAAPQGNDSGGRRRGCAAGGELWKTRGRMNVNGFNDDNNVNNDNNANNDTNVNDAHAVSDFMSGSHEYSAFPASFRENQACADVLMARNIAKITEKFVILHHETLFPWNRHLIGRAPNWMQLRGVQVGRCPRWPAAYVGNAADRRQSADTHRLRA